MPYNGFIARIESAYRFELYFGDDESIKFAKERLQNAISYHFENPHYKSQDDEVIEQVVIESELLKKEKKKSNNKLDCKQLSLF